MIIHVTTFTWVDGTPESSAAGLQSDLETHARQSSTLISYACGSDLGLRPGGDNFAVVAVAESPEALMSYLEDPEHKRIAGEWKSIIASKHSVQFETEFFAL